MQIQVTQLGLAAYVKMNGATLLKVENKVFHFESDKTTPEWRAQYANSESMQHDSLVCDLRLFLRPS
jgi:hypothetical protein